MYSLRRINLVRILLLFLLLVFILAIFLVKDNYRLKTELSFEKSFRTFDKNLKNNFNLNEETNKKFSNEFNRIGAPFDIVPNIVHYVLFTVHEIQFSHFISFLSVLKNQKPDRIYIHCDCTQLFGTFYERVLRVANKTNTQIIIRTIERPTEIFGQKLSEKWLNWHSSDITRIRVLLEFGGIYLDRDVYVVQSLDVFRKYEMTLNWGLNQLLENSILIAAQNARFLKLWLGSYHEYDPNQWYWNAGIVPTMRLLQNFPSIVHRVFWEFGAYGPDVCTLLYSGYFRSWRKAYYTFHLTIRGNAIPFKDWCFMGRVPKSLPEVFTEENVIKLNVTFGEMTRDLFDFEKQMINK